jgi:uncharacterized protein
MRAATPGVPALIWLEQGEPGAEPAPATQRQMDAWRAVGVEPRHALWQGPAFWQTVEIEDAPTLWQASSQALEAAC